MFDRYNLMIANKTYPAMPMSTPPVHVCETFFQSSVLAVGARAIWPLEAEALLQKLPIEVALDSVLLPEAADEVERIQHQLARRDGPVVCVERMQPGDADVPLERLMIERALSVNTAAAGGNASLMSIG
ncbi:MULTISPECIES: hypothetical protein [Variovorax]|jgi:RHH-type proline utilization regulon transcriptional repressor/proline dehydrogenase/delta 1-pyrroline-5-carboxylate dehydrogenase|nr:MULTISPECIES: hypothetical protein [Variovorax]MDR6456161.1 delta 1-pyrroline-5-carboxylate dehydrogenase [Variovorax paradoxus]